MKKTKQKKVWVIENGEPVEFTTEFAQALGEARKAAGRGEMAVVVNLTGMAHGLHEMGMENAAAIVLALASAVTADRTSDMRKALHIGAKEMGLTCKNVDLSA